MLNKLKKIKSDIQIKKIQHGFYDTSLVNSFHKIIRNSCSETVLYEILLKLSREWDGLDILELQELDEFNLYNNLMTIIDKKTDQNFKIRLLNDVNILIEFKLSSANSLDLEKKLVEQLFSLYNLNKKSKLRISYYRKIFKKLIHFPFCIIKRWQSLIEGLKQDTHFVRLYLLFTMNESMISKILEYLIDNQPTKFLKEIKQLISRDVDEFSHPTTFIDFGKKLIDKLLKEHQFSSKYVYNLIKDDQRLIKFLCLKYEHILPLENFNNIFKIDIRPSLSYEKIYHKFKSSIDDNRIILGKRIKETNYERAHLQLLKNACYVENKGNHSLIHIGNFDYYVIKLKNEDIEKVGKEYNWLILSIGENKDKNIKDDDFLTNYFTSAFINMIK